MSQRDDLLAGAKRCLIEKGYSHTTARDIAAASGAHLASIGYHFGSKNRLMTTAVLEATGEWGDTVEQAVREAGAEDPARRFEALISKLFQLIPASRELHIASAQAFAEAQFDDELRAALASGLADARTSLASMMAGAAAEQAGADDAHGVGSAVYAMVTGFLVQALIDPDSMPEADRVIEAVRLLAGPGSGS